MVRATYCACAVGTEQYFELLLVDGEDELYCAKVSLDRLEAGQPAAAYGGIPGPGQQPAASGDARAPAAGDQSEGSVERNAKGGGRET